MPHFERMEKTRWSWMSFNIHQTHPLSSYWSTEREFCQEIKDRYRPLGPWIGIGSGSGSISGSRLDQAIGTLEKNIKAVYRFFQRMKIHHPFLLQEEISEALVQQILKTHPSAEEYPLLLEKWKFLRDDYRPLSQNLQIQKKDLMFIYRVNCPTTWQNYLSNRKRAQIDF